MPAPLKVKLSIPSPQSRQSIKEQVLTELAQFQWEERAEQSCEYRLDGRLANGHWLRLKQYTNGTLYIEGDEQGVLDELMKLLGGTATASPVKKAVGNGSSGTSAVKTVQKPSGLLDITGTYIGTDESGKGDYFGPLVVAGVVVDDVLVEQLRGIGVMDSKKLNDVQISELAAKIRELAGEDSIAIVEMGPAKYNQLYDRFKQFGQNLNHMLAWAHATAIENLLEKSSRCLNPANVQAIADQFGSEHYILSKLKERGRQIRLHQTPRAEANPGVAAASILARHRFVGRMTALSRQYGMILPFGAGPKQAAVAQEFINRYGFEALANVVKLHFKTTDTLQKK